jgi:acyl-coenzyme A thioesterase PaaI-like protein
MVMPFRARNVGDSSLPALHGGTLGALLEAAALFELFAVQASSSAPGEALPRTINVTFDFQRSGRPVDTFAVAEVIRAGRRVATVHARAWQDDPKAPVATAQMHALLAE